MTKDDAASYVICGVAQNESIKQKEFFRKNEKLEWRRSTTKVYNNGRKNSKNFDINFWLDILKTIIIKVIKVISRSVLS